jgi:hypothetical protein
MHLWTVILLQSTLKSPCLRASVVKSFSLIDVSYLIASQWRRASRPQRAKRAGGGLVRQYMLDPVG